MEVRNATSASNKMMQNTCTTVNKSSLGNILYYSSTISPEVRQANWHNKVYQ